MPVIISMLRGVNRAAHNRIKMDMLRAIYEGLGLEDCRTFIQSGNVVFRTKERDLPKLATRIETAIERKAGFRPAVILRTVDELRKVVAGNPFATRARVEPNKLLVSFLAGTPDKEGREQALKMEIAPEEMHIQGREVYIYYANGMGRPKVSWTALDKILQTTGTGRNWNSVTKLLAIAEEMESSR